MLNFYDFEVFKYNWLVVIINPMTKTKEVIIDDTERLKKYFYAHEGEIWIGYNNRRYDQYVMKALLLDMNPKEVNDFIIRDDKPGWMFSSLFNQIKMLNFDTMLKTDTGLKSLEAFMGNDIRETSVPFDIDRPLTREEIEQTVFYCTHDVEQTIEVFLARKAEFDAAMGLIKIFNLPLDMLGKTGAQRVAKILGGKGQRFYNSKGISDEFEFEIVNTLKLNKYKHAAKWYRKTENMDYSQSQIIEVAGLPHTLAWGGLHGAPGEIQTMKSGKKRIKSAPYYGTGYYIMADVTAYYPSLQMRYKFGYRNMMYPENFEKIHGENLRQKALGDKVARLPYKIADNAISGQLKDPNSPLYDPRENNAITVNGQLLLVDLLEKLEPYCKLIQSNTDGILIKIKSLKDYSLIDDIVWEWEQRTGMRMGFDIYTKVYQKDVNNYLLVGANGKIKTKGAYTKALSATDYDLAIVNKALVDYMTKGIPVEVTVNACDDLRMFQKVFKLTSKYWRAWHNNQFMREKCYRVFASTDRKDTFIGKAKEPGSKIDKFANTPDHCFIDNSGLTDKAIPRKLDRSWYITEAKKRLRQYGVEVI